ncbi:bifunctional diguanylate cyclase/phosphohydrolase [Selenihalanaerobacter shriftii]|uniref:Diguanylate cyclase (GGDEF) domain-containing protein n=1 Tax=Selenihalanaerobacter shriftii TaxID=142842 RepID=A0A1T4L3M5_9FIRM|nr:HD domain-containing phosphohydrolase [Selenihalanaerobacter shriftii]SJZ49316.1 diguanylate cyclase (GGDEF) domain-containing protein [Selenihalanaerobacter shriftii]
MLKQAKRVLESLIKSRINMKDIHCKCFFWILNFIFLLILANGSLSTSIIKQLLLLLGLNIILLTYYYFSCRMNCSHTAYKDQIIQCISFALDLSFVSVLIFHSGGLKSPFILAYVLLLVSAGAKRHRISEVIPTGITGYVIYTITLYLYYKSFSFYFTPKFWIQSLLLGGVFINVVGVTWVLNNQTQQLRNAKEEAENLAKDLTERNEELERLSITDMVTELYNFKYFNERLKEEFQKAKEGNYKLGLIKIDLDDFKEYNDYVGMQQGDEALYQTGKILKELTRDSDIVTRLGDDEFGIIMIDITEDSSKKLAREIREKVYDYQYKGEENLTSGVLTASLGLAIYYGNINYSEELIDKVNEALYKVKLSHKNNIRVYTSVFEDLKKELDAAEGITSNMINTLRILLTIINARDRYTYGHSERVMKYALAIGKEMSLDEGVLQRLRYAAFLHDIGKIDIGHDVLNKKGRLNDTEWDLIKNHPTFGVNIIEPLEGLDDIIPAVMYHHERYDGMGYPEGLKGNKIPLLARILAVADSFDAMTTNRPYRAAFDCKEAIQELESEKGEQFDPNIVDAFKEVVNQVYENAKLCVS